MTKDSTEWILADLKKTEDDDTLDVGPDAALVATVVSFGVRALLLLVDLVAEQDK